MASTQSGTDESEFQSEPSRTLSNASDITPRSNNVSVPQANPFPAYIAQVAASDLVTSKIDRRAIISDAALILVNEFLDQVLYSILTSSRSSSLVPLKNAISSVLKPRLGKVALRVAEEELKEYLDDEDEFDSSSRQDDVSSRRGFDLDLIWRIARLRCMVYTRLGDLEEEDEQEWLRRDRLLEQLRATHQQYNTRLEGGIGPDSAIFLTSVLEYLGEQALYCAAQYAVKRSQVTGETGDLVIDGKDMNHVGRDSPLSRLWRSYRRNTREVGSRPLSPETVVSYQPLSISHSRESSAIHPRDVMTDTRAAAEIPLPISSTDIDEIEVPGIAPAYSDEEVSVPDDADEFNKRPSSLNNVSDYFGDGYVSADPPEIPARSPLRPSWERKRSHSSPAPSVKKRQNSRDIIAKRQEASAKIYAQVAGQPVATSENSRSDKLPNHITQFRNSGMAFTGDILPGLVSNNVMSSQELRNRELDDMHLAMPKRTVADQMLGKTASVAPPKDATTGASITNFSDFDSMHVPVITPTESPVPSGPPNGVVTSGPARYFPTSTSPKDRVYIQPDEDHAAATESDPKGLEPSLLRTASGRQASRGQSRGGTDSQSVAAHAHKTVTSQRNAPESIVAESPVSVFTSSSRPQSPDFTLPVDTSPVAPRGSSRGNAQTYDAQIHSRASSNGSRAAKIARDEPSQSQAVSQQRIMGAMTDQGRMAHAMTTTNSSREFGPDISNSAISKRVNGKQYALVDDSDEAKKKSLEVLIRSNETLHYTLTPAAAMRDDTLPQRNRAQPLDVSDSIQNSSNSAIAPKSPLLRTRGLTSNPPDPSSRLETVVTPTQRMASPSSPADSHGGAVSPARSRHRVGEPRDARAERSTSMRDLADYARSTGPHDAKQLPQSIISKSPVSGSLRSAVTPTQTERPPAAVTSPSIEKPSNRLKLQARDARPDRNAESSDLIDFIREGPQASGRQHRIDRKVAPFRTTMDSEDFNNLARQQNSTSSVKQSQLNNPGGRAVPSANPSVTSQTPLVASAGGIANGAYHTGSSRPTDTDDDGMPKRTQRRIKDPYAIEYSDDEDLDDTSGKRPQNQEESLIDFLRNTAPTSESVTRPVLIDRPSQRSSNSTPNTARATSPHLTQAGSKMDKYRRTQPTHAAHIDRNRSKPNFEARDAKATRTNTAELAEYLKNSGPAPNAQYKPQPFILGSISATPQPQPEVKASNKNDGGIFKMFSKRKK